MSLQRLDIYCREHGLIRSATVGCTHDAEDVTRTVANAHSATYGANCRSILDIEMVDPESGKPLDSAVHQVHLGTEQSDDTTSQVQQ